MLYTINAKTKATSFDKHDPEHIPMARNQFGDATPGYLRGWIEPNYQVPAIDYYNSNNPNHIPIGNMMEWAVPVEIQLKLRG